MGFHRAEARPPQPQHVRTRRRVGFYILPHRRDDHGPGETYRENAKGQLPVARCSDVASKTCDWPHTSSEGPTIPGCSQSHELLFFMKVDRSE